MGLILIELPGATVEALSEVFSFSGLYDMTKSILTGSARQVILNFLGVGLLNDLWLILTELRHGYAIYSVLSEFWEQISSAKDEYQIYDASDKLRPLIKDIVANAAKKEVIKRAERYVDEQEEQAQKEQKQRPKEITQEQKEKQILRAAKKQEKKELARAKRKEIEAAMSPLERLLSDTNDDSPFTEENAKLVLAGPPGIQPDIKGPSVAGADVIFRDKDGKILLKRELKSLTSIENIEGEITDGIDQLKFDPGGKEEIILQVPADSAIELQIKRFRGTIRKETHRQEKCKDVELIVLDSKGEIRYMGPILYDDTTKATN